AGRAASQPGHEVTRGGRAHDDLVIAPVRKLRFADVFVSRNGPCQCPHNPRNNPYWQELKFTVPCRDARGSASESLGAESRWSKLIRAKLRHACGVCAELVLARHS